MNYIFDLYLRKQWSNDLSQWLTLINREIHQKHELLEKSMKGNESSKTAR